jgi:hypothetical protein
MTGRLTAIGSREPDPRSPSLKGAQPMKFVEPSHFTDPDAAARKLLEIANATEPAQDGRIYIELVNAAFFKSRLPAEQFRNARAFRHGFLLSLYAQRFPRAASGPIIFH